MFKIGTYKGIEICLPLKSKFINQKQADIKKYCLFCISLFILFTIVSGCSKAIIDSGSPPPRYGKPYNVFGKTYYQLLTADGYREKGIASWYGKGFHGRKTSNGEKYDMYAMTAAHKSLPLGTYVYVRNLENSKEIRVRINDRGPFVDGRIIDLSYTAAKKLGITKNGTAYVFVEAVDPPVIQAATHQYVIPNVIPTATQKVSFSPAKNSKTELFKQAALKDACFSIQVGAFGNRENAERLRRRLKHSYSDDVHVYYNPSTLHYLVRVGKCLPPEQAASYEKTLSGKGYADAFVTFQNNL